MFNEYHCVQTALAHNLIGQIELDELSAFFQPFVNAPGLVVTPRLIRGQGVNGLSFRYCGLEVLQRRNGQYRVKLAWEGTTIRGTDRAVQNLGEAQNILQGVHDIVLAWLNAGAVPNVRHTPLPGFHAEHWLEGLIASDTPVGNLSRDQLQLSAVPAVATQCTVSLLPPPGKLNIDMTSSGDAQFSVIELKIDNAWTMACRELRCYTDWALGHPTTKKNGVEVPFAPQSSPADLMNQGIIPHFAPPLNPASLRAIAVIRTDRMDLCRPHENQFPIHVMRLPADWLAHARDNQPLFANQMYLAPMIP